MNTINYKNYIRIFFIFLILIFFILSTDSSTTIEVQNIDEEIRKNDLVVKERIEQDKEIKAKAISVYNLTKNRKVYGKNDTLVLPLASLAKIMSAIVILNNENLSETEVVVSYNALKQIGDNGLLLNEKWNIDELVKFSLISSSNDGIYALSGEEQDFIKKMNEKAKKIGLSNTVFNTTTGLDIESSKAGAYGTAEDMNTLATFAFYVHNDVFKYTAQREVDFISNSNYKHIARNTNLAVDEIPNLLFSKTGNTTLSGGNLTIIFQNSKEEKIAITVLGSTTEGRFVDIVKLVNILL